MFDGKTVHPDAASLPFSFDDGRGQFPDRIASSAPRGMRDDIRRAAQMLGITSASFIRDAVSHRVTTVLEGSPS